MTERVATGLKSFLHGSETKFLSLDSLNPACAPARLERLGEECVHDLHVFAREGRGLCAHGEEEDHPSVYQHNTENTLCWLLNKPASPSSSIGKYIRGAEPQTGQTGRFQQHFSFIHLSAG